MGAVVWAEYAQLVVVVVLTATVVLIVRRMIGAWRD